MDKKTLKCMTESYLETIEEVHKEQGFLDLETFIVLFDKKSGTYAISTNFEDSTRMKLKLEFLKSKKAKKSLKEAIEEEEKRNGKVTDHFS